MKTLLRCISLCSLFVTVFAAQSLAEDNFRYPIMPPDAWFEAVQAAESAPRAEIYPEVKAFIDQAAELSQPTSYSLLDHLDYDPVQRNQGLCGNCWVWAGTALLETALDVQENVFDRLSTQYLNSCKMDKWACCGGNLSDFASFYSAQGLAVPWDNSNASYTDGGADGASCPAGSSSMSCAGISSTPHYPITSISASTITTWDVSQATAIANIKTILNTDKAVVFNYALPNESAWSNFYDFWDGQTEASLWNDADAFCGTLQGDGGAHAVVLYGYNDDDPDPSNHYWMALNSWGTAGGMRPNGVFRVPMYLNYDCAYPDPVEPTNWGAFWFTILDVAFDLSSPEDSWIKWDDSIASNAAGLTDGGTFTVASRWLPGDLPNGKKITKIKVGVNDLPSGACSVKIWQGTDPASMVLKYSQPFTPVADSLNEIVLNTAYVIDDSKDLFFGWTATHSSEHYPCSLDAATNPNMKGNLLFNGEAWVNLSTEAGIAGDWLLHAYLEDAGSVECISNTDCTDGLFCTGLETCVGGQCLPGTYPCAGEFCIEDFDSCVECLVDGNCAANEICEDYVCETVCPYPPAVEDFDTDGNCLLSKWELSAAKTFYKNKHKAEKDALKASQAADKAFLKSLKAYAE